MIYTEERGKERVNVRIRLQRVRANSNRQGYGAKWAQVGCLAPLLPSSEALGNPLQLTKSHVAHVGNEAVPTLGGSFGEK